jgi:acetylornithine deacetylase/succinyl-diaminopimelate desuccinylase-like protein
VVSDTGLWSADVPTTVTAMRGHIDCQVDLVGPEEDIHSGSFGGAVRNPLHELATLLAGLHDSRGRVTIPGFYDDVAPLDEHERQLFAKLPFDEETWLSAALSRTTYGEAGYSTLERVWTRPTAEVNGLWGGYTGAGFKTVIPKAAHAKLSFRLVADQDPHRVVELVRRWVAASTPEGVTSSVTFGAGGRPCHTDWDDPAVDVLRAAMGKAFGTEVLIAREGGSGPEADLAEVVGAPVVFLGVGLPDDRFHGPDERVRIPMLVKGAESAAHLWSDLAAADLPRHTARPDGSARA